MLIPTLLLQCSLNNAANEKLKGMLSFSFSYCVTRGRFTPFCKTARWKKQYREHTPTMGNTLNTDLHGKCHLVLSLGNKTHRRETSQFTKRTRKRGGKSQLGFKGYYTRHGNSRIFSLLLTQMFLYVASKMLGPAPVGFKTTSLGKK